jgi:hypothetical protein
MKCYILIAGLLGTLALASPVADPVADPIADPIADAVADPGNEHGYGYKTCEQQWCKPVKCHGYEWVCLIKSHNLRIMSADCHQDMCKCQNNWQWNCKKSCSDYYPKYKVFFLSSLRCN